MVNILGIQFRTTEAAIMRERVSLERQLGSGVVLECIDALDTNLVWAAPETILAGYAGVVLGGSGDLDFDGDRPIDDAVRQISQEILERLRPVFQYIFDHDIPTLGICYGHQILGTFAGAEVRCDANQRKTKSHEVQFLVDKHKHFLFTDLPDTFYGHYGHKDVVDRVPEGALLLLQGGEGCQVSALQYKKNIYTVQFHPELTYLEMVDRIKSSPGYLPEGVDVEEVFKDDPSSNLIVRNFAKLVELHSGVVSPI